MRAFWKRNNNDENYDSEKSIYENKDIKTIDDNEIYKILRREIFTNNEYACVYKAEMLWGYLMLTCSLALLFFVFCYKVPQNFICECVALTFSCVLGSLLILIALLTLWLRFKKVKSRNSVREAIVKVLDVENSKYDDVNKCIIERIERSISRDKNFSFKSIGAFAAAVTVLGTLFVSLGSSLLSNLFNNSAASENANFIIILIYIGVALLFLAVFFNFVPNFVKNSKRFYSEEIVIAYKDAIYRQKVNKL